MRIGATRAPAASTEVPIAVPATEELVIRWSGGHRSRYRWRWLRDCCPCDRCVGDGSGQRLADLRALPSEPRAVSSAITGGHLLVHWDDHDHVSRFDLDWLQDRCCCWSHLDDRAGSRQAPVDGTRCPLPVDWSAVATDDRALAWWLETVATDGWARLQGVPAGHLPAVVDRFGYIRETNYGRVFDVRADVPSANLAFSTAALAPHTDNPYRHPVPTLQLLHCLTSSVEGGQSIMVDGFAAAGVLRRERPEAFAQLATWPVPWRYADGSVDLATEAPVIELGPGGTLVAIRFNERSRGPLRLDPDVVDDHLLALRRFANILDRPELQVRTTLGPGDLLLFDNRRMLHGRTAYSSAGGRHLQGCYADRDGLDSKLAVLRRNILGVTMTGLAVDSVLDLLRTSGQEAYLGEPVSVAEHSLQAARAAELDDAGSTLVVAALLHDVGWLLRSGSRRHEQRGADFLATMFGPAVTEPVRLHVPAKRYLCTIDPDYRSVLSGASRRTLRSQGGLLDEQSREAFAAEPYAGHAIRLRLYDDQAKVPGADVADLDHYAPLVAQLLTR